MLYSVVPGTRAYGQYTSLDSTRIRPYITSASFYSATFLLAIDYDRVVKPSSDTLQFVDVRRRIHVRSVSYEVFGICRHDTTQLQPFIIFLRLYC